MKQIIRWGILGTGQIATQFANGLNYLKDSELCAVGARSKDKADNFAQQHNIARAYGSFAELLAEPDIDVVYIATPHHVHHEHCIMALEAGKAVLCEKPFTINAVQAQQVIDLAREKKLFCMEAMWMRFLPAMQKLTSMLADNAIGELSMLRAEFGTPFKYNPDGRAFDIALAGGALLDLGVYPISLSYKLFGPPVEIMSMANIGDSGVDEASSIILRHASDKISTIRCSLRHELTPEAVVVGSKGSMRIESPLYRPHKFNLSEFDLVEPEKNAGSSPSKVKQFIKNAPFVQKLALHVENYVSPLVSALGNTVVPFEGNGYNYQAAAVNQCLRDGKLECEIMPLDETLGVLKVMDDIRDQWGLRYPGE